MAAAGVCMVKDEADVIAGTLQHLAAEVDFMVVADNGSTDGTRDILRDLSHALPLTVIDDPDPAYYQSAKMGRLAERAVERGAIWIVPFDADEVWFSHEDRIAKVLRTVSGNVVPVTLYNHFPSAIDPAGPDPFRTIVWRQRDPGALPKVAFRWETGAAIHQGNHGVTLPAGEQPQDRGFEIRHFPYRSADQFVSKARNGAAAYRATELPEDMGAHWRAYGALLDRFGEDALRGVFREHFWNLSPIDAGLVHDPAPYMRWLVG